MRLKDIKDEVKRHVKDYTTETELAIEMAANNVLFELRNKFNWWFARERFYFDTIAKYNTGTITATNGSAVITGSGTTFTSAMVGRKLIVGGDSTAYRVKTFTSATSITLESVYQGTTVSGSTYGIFKHIYRLNDRVMRILWAMQNADKVKIRHVDARYFDEAKGPWNTSYGKPTHYIPRGQTTTNYYETGTVSVTSGSAAVTGSGTTFTSDMVGMVFKVVGDEVEYVISGFTSATAITLDTNYDGTTNAAASYAVGPWGTEEIELWPAPETVMQVEYFAQLRAVKMINDNDVADLPQQWHYGILHGTLAEVLPGRAIDEAEIDRYEKKYAAFLKDVRSWHNVNEDENPFFKDTNNPEVTGGGSMWFGDDNSWVFQR